LLRENVPTACAPTEGTVPTGAVRVHVTPVRLLPAVIVPPSVTAPVTADPDQLIEQPAPLVAALDVPELVRVTMQAGLAAILHDVTCAETCAELVKDPKSPNTNPAMATAAMRVMAMRMTVASTGEMAFLFFLRTFSMFIVRLNACCSVYKSRMEYLSSFR
jgi:hypothetical protein